MKKIITFSLIAMGLLLSTAMQAITIHTTNANALTVPKAKTVTFNELFGIDVDWSAYTDLKITFESAGQSGNSAGQLTIIKDGETVFTAVKGGSSNQWQASKTFEIGTATELAFGTATSYDARIRNVVITGTASGEEPEPDPDGEPLDYIADAERTINKDATWSTPALNLSECATGVYLSFEYTGNGAGNGVITVTDNASNPITTVTCKKSNNYTQETPVVNVPVSNDGNSVIITFKATTNNVKIKNLKITCGEVYTSINDNSVSDKTPVSTNYYNINGVETSQPENGIFIKQTLYEDGSVHASKVFVNSAGQ